MHEIGGSYETRLTLFKSSGRATASSSDQYRRVKVGLQRSSRTRGLPCCPAMHYSCSTKDTGNSSLTTCNTRQTANSSKYISWTVPCFTILIPLISFVSRMCLGNASSDSTAACWFECSPGRELQLVHYICSS
jgi:hypothetical protein